MRDVDVIKFVRDLRATGQWFSPNTPVSSTNKTDRYDIAKILLKVALNTITIHSVEVKQQRVKLHTGRNRMQTASAEFL